MFVSINTSDGVAKIDQKRNTLAILRSDYFETADGGFNFIKFNFWNKGDFVEIDLNPRCKPSQEAAMPEAPINMVSTDFAVQNADDFSVKKNTTTSDYIQFGLITVLSAAVVYLYKDNRTLKRVANGSDYEKM